MHNNFYICDHVCKKNNIIKIAGSLKEEIKHIETTECTTDNNFTKKPFKKPKKKPKETSYEISSYYNNNLNIKHLQLGGLF